MTSTLDSESIKSVCIKQTIAGMDCTYAVACQGDNDNLSCCTQFDPCGNGEKLWKDLAENGKLTEASKDEKLKGMCVNVLRFKFHIISNFLFLSLDSFMHFQPRMLVWLFVGKLRSCQIQATT